MKKFIFIASAVMLSCFSCNDLLTEDPRGLLSANQFFTTEDEGVLAVNGIYSHLNNPRNLNLINTLTLGTDEIMMPIPIPGGTIHSVYVQTTSDSRTYEYWLFLYEGIRDTNLTINRLSDSPINEERKNELISEAKFLRSFYYYYLVILFGDVPYWTEELVVEDVSTLGKTPANEILANLITDLDEAESFLSESTFGGNGSRVTKWTAKMLKAKIYLWLEDWPNAKTESEEIITLSPHRLLPNFGDVFRASNERNDEIIFAVEYLLGVFNSGRTLQWRPSAPFEANVSNPGWFDGISGYAFLQSFVDSYAPNDIRRKYTVLDSLNGESLNWNWVLKVLMVPLPEDDPLIDVAERRLQSDQDEIYMRLADTYLTLAEAENEANGPTQTAFDAINAVRNRAGLANLEGLNQEELRQAIRDERGKELAGEAVGRKQDLIRWDILVETVKNLPAEEQEAFLNNPGLSEGYKNKIMFDLEGMAARIGEKNNFIPIPSDEIAKNPNLEQNPLWE